MPPDCHQDDDASRARRPKPEALQEASTGLTASQEDYRARDRRLRYTYHPPPDDETVGRHERVRKAVRRCAEDLDEELPEGRERSLAHTKLEEAMMWANAAIARAHASGLE